MDIFRFSLAGISLLTLAAWYWFRQPYSPSQELAPVSFAAFRVDVASPEGGTALARAVREWPGITAATYNPDSGLLAVGFRAQTTESDIQGRIAILLPGAVHKMEFPPATGPQCPVPLALLTKIPGILLLTGVSSGLLWLLFWFYPKRFQPFLAPARS